MPAIKTMENVALGQIMLHLPSWAFLLLPLQCLFQIIAKEDKHCSICRFRVVMPLLHQKSLVQLNHLHPKKSLFHAQA